MFEIRFQMFLSIMQYTFINFLILPEINFLHSAFHGATLFNLIDGTDCVTVLAPISM